mmetsp:Transcript_23539/g.76093  ORF Transcript_23539/g.76093 Transcript_23539/m.76093 type:complete len:295 (+) Transcript_23539:495-1379(+)
MRSASQENRHASVVSKKGFTCCELDHPDLAHRLRSKRVARQDRRGAQCQVELQGQIQDIVVPREAAGEPTPQGALEGRDEGIAHKTPIRHEPREVDEVPVLGDGCELAGCHEAAELHVRLDADPTPHNKALLPWLPAVDASNALRRQGQLHVVPDALAPREHVEHLCGVRHAQQRHGGVAHGHHLRVFGVRFRQSSQHRPKAFAKLGWVCIVLRRSRGGLDEATAAHGCHLGLQTLPELQEPRAQRQLSRLMLAAGLVCVNKFLCSDLVEVHAARAESLPAQPFQPMLDVECTT